MRVRIRDANLVRDVEYGVRSPEEGDERSIATGFGPLLFTPNASNFDPMGERFWTVSMALAWIVWRQPHALLLGWPKFMERQEYWADLPPPPPPPTPLNSETGLYGFLSLASLGQTTPPPAKVREIRHRPALSYRDMLRRDPGLPLVVEKGEAVAMLMESLQQEDARLRAYGTAYRTRVGQWIEAPDFLRYQLAEYTRPNGTVSDALWDGNDPVIFKIEVLREQVCDLWRGEGVPARNPKGADLNITHQRRAIWFWMKANGYDYPPEMSQDAIALAVQQWLAEGQKGHQPKTIDQKTVGNFIRHFKDLRPKLLKLR